MAFLPATKSASATFTVGITSIPAAGALIVMSIIMLNTALLKKTANQGFDVKDS